jgi:lipopolysaccharide export system permease protein
MERESLTLNTFDRYLLRRYFHVVMVFTVAAIGLFVVVDGFTNLDEFQLKQKGSAGGTLALLLRFSRYYLYQSALIIDMIGPTILVIASMSVLALMLRQGEIHPVLAAGVPTYRATRPLILGVLAVNFCLGINQEIILPAVAPHLQGRRGDLAMDTQKVEPQYDYLTRIFISGTGIVPAERRLDGPEFLLPTPVLATDFTVLRAEYGIHHPASEEGPAGWELKNISPPYESLPLTDAGRRLLILQPNGRDLFVQTTLPFEQLNRQASNPSLMGTPELIRRIQQPSITLQSRRKLLVKLHERLTRPLLTVVGLYLVIPLIIRKERMSVMQQVTNIATCMGVLGVVFGVTLGMQLLGSSGFLQPDQAVWGPLIASGGLATWLSGVVRT